MEIILFFLIAFGVLIAFAIGVYNRLITLRNRSDNAWAQVDVQLRRRYDLIPNLVETVKGYAKHEKDVFENVTKARAGVRDVKGGVSDRVKAENQLTRAMIDLYAVAEGYPDLKANETFQKLMGELSDIENKLAAARRFFNANVRDMNTRVQSFPTNLVAGAFSFDEEEYFEVEASKVRRVVPVSFGE